ncbi:hypothetical protein C8R44DRAFT_857907 [Mycena epipterygia]|nr:hypothetical protein C8R44DRAFT_857907 [Mycena epipterygia]
MSTLSRHTWSTCVEAHLVHTSEVKMTVKSVVGGPKFKAAFELGTERMYHLDLIVIGLSRFVNSRVVTAFRQALITELSAAAQPVIRAGRNAVGAGKVLNERLACIETADCALFSGPRRIKADLEGSSRSWTQLCLRGVGTHPSPNTFKLAMAEFGSGSFWRHYIIRLIQARNMDQRSKVNLKKLKYMALFLGVKLKQ